MTSDELKQLLADWPEDARPATLMFDADGCYLIGGSKLTVADAADLAALAGLDYLAGIYHGVEMRCLRVDITPEIKWRVCLIVMHDTKYMGSFDHPEHTERIRSVNCAIRWHVKIKTTKLPDPTGGCE